MTYIGRRKNRGAWYVHSEYGGVRQERNYPCLTEDQFYEALRTECRLPQRLTYRELYREVTENFRWDGSKFVSA